MNKLFAICRETAWCPGCGNFGILNALSQALDGLGSSPKMSCLCQESARREKHRITSRAMF